MKPAALILLLPFIALAGDTPTNPGSPAAPSTTARYQLLSAPLTAAGDTTDLQLQVILRLDTTTGNTEWLRATASQAGNQPFKWEPIPEASDSSQPAPNPTQPSKTPTKQPPIRVDQSIESYFRPSNGFA